MRILGVIARGDLGNKHPAHLKYRAYATVHYQPQKRQLEANCNHWRTRLPIELLLYFQQKHQCCEWVA